MKLCAVLMMPDAISECVLLKRLLRNNRISESSEKNLNTPCREEFDTLDGEILELLNKRAAASLSVGKLKAWVRRSDVLNLSENRKFSECLTERNPGPASK